MVSEVGVRIEWNEPHVAELIMDRPEALNALSTVQAEQLSMACAELAADRQLSVVMVRSSSDKAFCVGADLKERRDFTDDDLRAQRTIFTAAFGAVLAMPMPMIAAVDGYALGGGCELALACDLIVASTSAVFGLPEVGLGLIPGGGGTQLLPRRIGPGRAADLIYTGRRIEAGEAYRIGLVDALTETSSASDHARTLAAQIARQSPVSLRSAKRSMREGLDTALASGLAIEDRAWAEAAFSADRREGIEAFNSSRSPVWPSWTPAD